MKLKPHPSFVCILFFCCTLSAGQTTRIGATPHTGRGSPQSKELYELKGDKLGETLAVFKANHPSADCRATTSKITDCDVLDDISIAGVVAYGLSSAKCKAARVVYGWEECLQSMGGRFFDSRLVTLSYNVFWGDDEKNVIVEALKKKFGAPSMETRKYVMWSNDVAFLAVIVATEGTHSLLIVQASLNDTGADKDI